MNSLRRVFCFSMAIMIAAFALPGLAAPQSGYCAATRRTLMILTG